MAESVAELLGRLRFVGGPVETLYLNQTRVRESFIGQLGAIESFTRTATKEGSVELPVVKVGAGLTSEADVTWSLANPTAQVMVLRAALESQGALHGLDGAAPGRYICFAGVGLVSRPNMLDDRHRAGLQEHPGLYDALEAERATQENVLRMMEGPKAAMWLLTVSDDAHGVGAAVLDQRWISASSPSWVFIESPWEIFAMFRGRHETAASLLAALHVSVKW
jgi:hypothetical protein